MKSVDFDIIISTVPLEYESKPTIVTSVFVTEEDIKNITKYIGNIESTTKFNWCSLQMENNDLFDKNLILANINIDSKEELIKELGKLLVKKDLVYKGFIHSALDRESITSTAVGKGVAIPHGKQEFVKKPAIVLATLKDPIDWCGEQVDIIFMLALKFGAGSVTRNFFKGFYSMLDDEQILMDIRNKKTPQEIYYVLKGKDDLDGEYYQQKSN